MCQKKCVLQVAKDFRCCSEARGNGRTSPTLSYTRMGSGHNPLQPCSSARNTITPTPLPSKCGIRPCTIPLFLMENHYFVMASTQKHRNQQLISAPTRFSFWSDVKERMRASGNQKHKHIKIQNSNYNFLYTLQKTSVQNFR